MKPFDRHQTAGQAEYERTVLRTPEWAACREAVLERDRHKCRFCGCQDELQVHHIDYADVFNPAHCVTLCRTCHLIVTEAVKQAKEADIKIEMKPSWNASPEALRKRYKWAICAAKSKIVVKALLEIWKSTFNRDGARVQMRNPNVLRPISHIVEMTINEQTALHTDDEAGSYVKATIDACNEYAWSAYQHYRSEGFTDKEIERFLKLEPGKIKKIAAHVTEYGAGGEDSG